MNNIKKNAQNPLKKMRPVFWVLLPAVLVSFLFPSPGFKAKGLGGSFASVTGHIESFMYNPAGLGGGKEAQAMIGYTQFYPGLTGIRDIFVGYLQPFLTVNEKKVLAVSVQYNNFSISDIVSVDSFGLGLALSMFVIKPLSSQQILTELLIGFKGKFVNRKYTYESEYDDILFARGNSKAYFTIGAGITARFIKSVGLGVFINNMNTPDQGLIVTDKLPIEAGVGADYTKEWDSFKLMGTAGYEYSERLHNIKAGIDAGIFKMVFIRAGVSYPAGNNVSVSAGAGFEKKIGKIGLEINGAVVFVPAIFHSISKVHNYAFSLIVSF